MKNNNSIKPLTPRELQILQLIVAGQTDQEIARSLEVTVHTINAFRKILLQKLGANNTASLVRIAIQQALVNIT